MAKQEKQSIQTLRIDQELLLRFKIFAANTRQTQQDVLYTALVEYLNRHDKPSRRKAKTSK